MATDSLIVNLTHATRMIQKGSMSVGVDKTAMSYPQMVCPMRVLLITNPWENNI